MSDVFSLQLLVVIVGVLEFASGFVIGRGYKEWRDENRQKKEKKDENKTTVV